MSARIVALKAPKQNPGYRGDDDEEEKMSKRGIIERKWVVIWEYIGVLGRRGMRE